MEPLALAEAGFDVTVVDVAPSAVAVQRARFERLNIRVRVEQADLFAWKAGEPFEAIYDQTCLCALPPPIWPAYELRLHAWLRPGGTLFILFMQSDRPGGPPFNCDLGTMRRLFALDRWNWPAELPKRVEHPSGLAEQPAILTRR
jgi:hypothetical protein